jgi:hypothetical protein
MVVSFLLASGLTACGGGGGSLPGTVGPLTSQLTSAQSTLPHITTTLSNSTANNAAASYIAIDAGGGAAGAYVADADFSGGWTGAVTTPINTSQVSNPAPQSAYQTQRCGANLVYTLPNLTPNAAYSIRLHFVESYFQSAGQRLFGVTVNGTPALTNFDIYKAAGGSNIAIAKTIAGKADATGKITIAFAATVNNASLAAIEVSSSTVSTPAPIVQGVPVNVGGTASGGWLADTDYVGGWVAPATSAAVNTSHDSNPAPQAVYQTQRVGTFSYVVPKLSPNSKYTVRLLFVESYFTSPGQRLFNVTVNGAQVLSNFDIYQAASGSNRAIVESFGTMADASGSITAQFSPTVNNAALAGLEIVAGSSTVVPPSPTPAPTTGNNPYYNYSGHFTGKTPFHDTIAKLQNAGVLALESNQSTVANNFWSEGVAGNQTPYGGVPQWIGSSDPAQGQSLRTWTGMTLYGGPTNLNNKRSWFPAGATGQNSNYDAHASDDDPTSPDGGGNFGGFECGTTGPTLTHCGWGAYYPYSGSGLQYDTPGYSGNYNAGGYAQGLFMASAYDMYNAAHGIPIAHALGFVTSCETNSQGYYPSPSSNSDGGAANCSGGQLPNTHYGSLIQLNQNFNIAGSGASQYCQYLLQALKTYGAYTFDNDGGYGITLGQEDPYVYDLEPGAGQPNYWKQTIYPSLNAGGDGHLSGTPSPSNPGGFSWTTCLNRIPSGNGSNYWIIYHITTTTSGLP